MAMLREVSNLDVVVESSAAVRKIQRFDVITEFSNLVRTGCGHGLPDFGPGPCSTAHSERLDGHKFVRSTHRGDSILSELPLCDRRTSHEPQGGHADRNRSYPH